MTIRNPHRMGSKLASKLANSAVGSASQSIGRTREHFRRGVADRCAASASPTLAECLARGPRRLRDLPQPTSSFICAIYPVDRHRPRAARLRLRHAAAAVSRWSPASRWFGTGRRNRALRDEPAARARRGRQLGPGLRRHALRRRSARSVALGVVLLVIFAFWVGNRPDDLRCDNWDRCRRNRSRRSPEAVLTTEAGRMMVVPRGSASASSSPCWCLSSASSRSRWLLDRDIGVVAAMWTSLRAVARNPVADGGPGVSSSPAGSSSAPLPLFLGLIVIHCRCSATRRGTFYRKVVATYKPSCHASSSPACGGGSRWGKLGFPTGRHRVGDDRKFPHPALPPQAGEGIHETRPCLPSPAPFAHSRRFPRGSRERLRGSRRGTTPRT